jgi:hypothetical protein
MICVGEACPNYSPIVGLLQYLKFIVRHNMVLSKGINIYCIRYLRNSQYNYLKYNNILGTIALCKNRGLRRQVIGSNPISRANEVKRLAVFSANLFCFVTFL